MNVFTIHEPPSNWPRRAEVVVIKTGRPGQELLKREGGQWSKAVAAYVVRRVDLPRVRRAISEWGGELYVADPPPPPRPVGWRRPQVEGQQTFDVGAAAKPKPKRGGEAGTR